MSEPAQDHELERMADEIFDLTKISSMARAHARTGQPEELTEAEFLALDVLVQSGSMGVGDIQKRIGVLPAQMSRIVRSLEQKGEGGFISCSINCMDRRRIDVKILAKGRAAHRAYRVARRKFAINLLEQLTPEDRNQFMRILDKMRLAVSNILSDM